MMAKFKQKTDKELFDYYEKTIKKDKEAFKEYKLRTKELALYDILRSYEIIINKNELKLNVLKEKMGIEIPITLSIESIKSDVESKIEYYKKQNRCNFERLHSKINDFQTHDDNNTHHYDTFDTLVGHCRDNCAKIKELENLLGMFD